MSRSSPSLQTTPLGSGRAGRLMGGARKPNWLKARGLRRGGHNGGRLPGGLRRGMSPVDPSQEGVTARAIRRRGGFGSPRPFVRPEPRSAHPR